MSFEVSRVQVDLRGKKANVTLTKDRVLVSVHGMPFDPPGDQTESQIDGLALAQAKRIIVEAGNSL